MVPRHRFPSLLHLTIYGALACAAFACAVGVDPEPSQGDDDSERGGSLNVGGTGVPLTGGSSSAGKSTPFGGSSSTGGADDGAGGDETPAGGSVSNGGSSSAGTSSAGTSSAGSSSAGTSSAGTSSGGSGSTECGGVKAWAPGDYMLTLQAGDVVHWKGKRYKANQAIDYPNPECSPDAPMAWCAGWFSPDGDC
jgi:hypothetical protein